MAFLVGERYLMRNFSTSPFHIVTKPRGNVFNYACALSLKEYGNNFILKASSDTLDNLDESLTSIKFLIK